MIDYNKLQEAHEIVEKMDARASVEVCFYSCGEPKYVFNAPTSDDCFCVNSVNELVKKLRELTQPEPKYNEGQKVFWSFNNSIHTGLTDAAIKTDGGYRYQIDALGDPVNIHESQLYPSREELVAEQIGFWNLEYCKMNIHEYQDHTGECCWCGVKE